MRSMPSRKNRISRIPAPPASLPALDLPLGLGGELLARRSERRRRRDVAERRVRLRRPRRDLDESPEQRFGVLVIDECPWNRVLEYWPALGVGMAEV
jgi:hypothetical protein